MVAGRDPTLIGTTTTAGELPFRWETLIGLVQGRGWERQASILDSKGNTVGLLDLAEARKITAERAWQNAKLANTAAAYRTYQESFPEAHADESVAGYRSARIPALTQETKAAIARKDVPSAKTLLAEWRDLAPDDPSRSEVEREFEILDHEQTVAKLMRALQDAIDAVAKSTDKIDALARVGAALDEAKKVAPNDPGVKRAEVRVAAARALIVRELLNRAAQENDFEEAARLIEQASPLAADTKAIEQARALLKRRMDAQAKADERRAAARSKWCLAACTGKIRAGGWFESVKAALKPCMINKGVVQHQANDRSMDEIMFECRDENREACISSCENE
jgi:hypothetical protein